MTDEEKEEQAAFRKYLEQVSEQDRDALCYGGAPCMPLAEVAAERRHRELIQTIKEAADQITNALGSLDDNVLEIANRR